MRLASEPQTSCADDPSPCATQDVGLDDFPLPTLGPKLRALLRQVTHGRGFQLLSGVPVWRWTTEQSVLAYWGMGLYWGSVRPINKQVRGWLEGAAARETHALLVVTALTRAAATCACQPCRATWWGTSRTLARTQTSPRPACTPPPPLR